MSLFLTLLVVSISVHSFSFCHCVSFSIPLSLCGWVVREKARERKCTVNFLSGGGGACFEFFYIASHNADYRYLYDMLNIKACPSPLTFLSTTLALCNFTTQCTINLSQSKIKGIVLNPFFLFIENYLEDFYFVILFWFYMSGCVRRWGQDLLKDFMPLIFHCPKYEDSWHPMFLCWGHSSFSA